MLPNKNKLQKAAQHEEDQIEIQQNMSTLHSNYTLQYSEVFFIIMTGFSWPINTI